MAGRVEAKKVLVSGAGQSPGETIGNGRAISMLFAREGAEVVCVDRDLRSDPEPWAKAGRVVSFRKRLDPLSVIEATTRAP